ncbi:MAG: hypothetical protein C5B54_08710 [Acidobacteria bacterium]|nr:MAG: hypothetical protein C5B54_08710 [Acidobacteriota bacterium]
MRNFSILCLGFLALFANISATTSPSPLGIIQSDHYRPDSNWDKVLSLGKIGSSQCEGILLRISKGNSLSAALARGMLRNWSKDRNTYFLLQPIPIKEPPGVRQIRTPVGGWYQIQVLVDARGIGYKVDVSAPILPSEPYYAHPIGEWLYCPIKKNGQYVPSRVEYLTIADE